MKRLFYITVALGLLLSAACSNNGCLSNRSAIPLASLYSSTTGSQITLSNIDVYGVGAPGDSMLVTHGEAVGDIYLPMRSTAQSVSWVIHYTDAALDSPDFNDTITIDYTSTPFFASEECGAMYYYTITRLTHSTHVIDSVVITIPDSLVSNLDLETMRIYFRTASADQPETSGQ